jgi:hypothetical protein
LDESTDNECDPLPLYRRALARIEGLTKPAMDLLWLWMNSATPVEISTRELDILIYVFTRNPPFYRAIEPHLLQHLNADVRSRMYGRIGLSGLHFGAAPTEEVLLTRYSDAVEFWRCPVAYRDTGFSRKVQELFFFTRLYPQSSFLDGSDMFSSVIGSAIVSAKHFVDVVAATAQRELKAGKATGFPPIFLELVSFLFLEVLYKRVTDPRVNHTNWIDEVIQNSPCRTT